MADISRNCVSPVNASHLPAQVEEMIQKVSDEQEMILEAVMNNDDELLVRAFCSDSLMNLDRQKARELFEKMLIQSRLRYN